MLPLSFDGLLTIQRENHNYNTRNKDDFNIPLQKQKVKTVFTTGPKIWNDLPNSTKFAKTLGHFKQIVKSHFLTS